MGSIVVATSNKASEELGGYLVGDLFITTRNENPATRFGGTWKRYAKGRVLVGIDEEQTEFNTVNKEVGSKTETLGLEHLPSTLWQAGWAGGAGALNLLFNKGDSYGINALGTGKDQPHNNIQPSIAVYIWIKTA